MRITELIDPLFRLAMPLTSALLALPATLLLPVLTRRVRSTTHRVLILALGAVALGILWHAAAAVPSVERWLTPVSSPLVAVYLVIILPALVLPRESRWYALYRIVPATMLLLAAFAVLDAYRAAPEDAAGFYWFLIRPVYLLGAVASLLVLVQPLWSLARFRFAVRLACFVVLVYGGFMFRQDYRDYQEMRQRRRDATDIMLVSETMPVMQHDRRMLHLPSAPCRFTADGGYVQGCNLELFQRLMQVDMAALWRGDEGTIASVSVITGAVLLFLILCFIAARWTCGWVCPLSSIGSILDGTRKRLGLPHLKPVQPLKMSLFFSGLGVAGITLAMARAYPRLNEDGKFLGCKIPAYPFCKICPSQQLCPVVAGGPGAYPGLPTREWGGGFFLVACLALLTLFLAAFATGRNLWCRFCPMGMISGLFNRGGAFRLLKDAQKCNRCGVCADVCPMDIDSVRAEMNRRDVSSFDCILCLKCIDQCPKDGCLSLEHAGVTVAASRFAAGNTSRKPTSRRLHERPPV